jgi:hypothetical protein
MKIIPVSDPAFRPYGRVVEGYPVEGLLEALAKTPLPKGTAYVPKDETLHAAKDAEAVGEALFGGMPFQLGWCNGHNTKLNCLEYHRDSESNLSPEEFILILAKMDDIAADGTLDTAKAKAFRVPAGVMVEVYATTLHYAPCQTSDGGFRVAIVLPRETNTDIKKGEPKNFEDKLLWARNKWLLAHADSAEAKQGAYIGLKGENVSV